MLVAGRHTPWEVTMSIVEAVAEQPTELRLDYKDVLAGRVVIVIDGLPAGRRDPMTPDSSVAVSTVSGSSTIVPRPSGPLVDEAAAIGETIGNAPALFTPLLLAAWKGREAATSELVAATIEQAPFADSRVSALSYYANAVLYNGLGRYEHAVVAAQRACTHGDPGFLGRASLELVEAAARTDVRAGATTAVRHLEELTRGGADWALGAWARSVALLSSGGTAEILYREAIERLERAGTGLHRARAQLVYGEWLRRENRRVDAREQLRAAHQTLSSSGAEGFAERARRELLATGETARRRTDETRDALTAQEAQIARLARDGFSNPEIGVQLFISPRTVQYHLRKVFQKLDVSSRNQLGRLPASRLSSA
jgi:DNA-binding CsgD family transcriptional regulator